MSNPLEPQPKMADGQEEREEREQRRGQEERENRSDHIAEDHDEVYEPERVDSKTAQVLSGENDPKKAESELAADKAAEAHSGDLKTSSGLIESDRLVLKDSARRTRRSFVIAAAAAAAAYTGYNWIDKSPLIGRQQKPLRNAFNANAEIARGVFQERGIAPTFAKSKAVADLRFNGPYGLRQEIVLDTWRLKLVGVEDAKQYKQFVPDVTAWEYKEVDSDAMARSIAAGSGQAAPAPPSDDSKGPAEKPAVWTRALNGDGTPMRGQEEAGDSDSDLDPFTPGLLLTLADIKTLPHHELVTEFKCIEGWSEVVYWGGYRLADLIAAYPPARNAKGDLPRYVYMETPFGYYYCGYNMSACTHPQSLLATEMSGAPLTQNHGAPLRLHMPIKYGYKQIKRIALIAYTDKQPDDYWTKLGYDWYAGL